MTKGTFETITRIKADAVPIDNVTKYAWADDDYETVEVWHEYTTEELQAERLSQIEQLRQQLSATDYVTIKIAEGAATAEEYADVLAQRRAWREKINELEEVEV